MRLWGGRFSEANDARVEAFTASIDVDRELAADDLAGSIAHVHGLGRAGLLTDAQVDELVGGLTALAEDVAAGRMAWDPALEDVHLNLEAALTERIGPVAGRLHTGRSRNDQVATDMRLWTRRAIDRLDAANLAFEHALVGLAERRRRGDPARHDAYPAGPARALRPSPAGLRRDGRARPGPARGRPAAPERLAAGRGRPGRRRLSPRPRDDGRRARLRWRDRELARCGERSRFRRRGARGDGARDGPPEPPGRGDHLVVEPALRVRSGGRCLLDRQLDHAQQEEPGSGRAGPRPRCPRHRGADRRARDAEGLPLAYQRDLQEDKPPLFDAVAGLRGVAGRARRDARHAGR